MSVVRVDGGSKGNGEESLAAAADDTTAPLITRDDEAFLRVFCCSLCTKKQTKVRQEGCVRKQATTNSWRGTGVEKESDIHTSDKKEMTRLTAVLRVYLDPMF